MGGAYPEPPPVPAPTKSKIFLVHGHNNEATYELARFLEKEEKLDVRILREELNKGSEPLLIKLERLAAEATYGVVLFTADDEGRKRGDPYLELRARQNVVFEMGLSFGLVKKENVCVVYEPGVKLPSDIEGIMRVDYIKGGDWKFQVARQIKGTLKPPPSSGISLPTPRTYR